MSESPYPPPAGGNDPTVPYQAPQLGQGYPQQGYPQQGYQPGYPQAQYAYPGAPQQYAVPQVDQYGRPLSDKSKIVAGVLGIALGGFGAGRFYTGHTGMAIAQLVVTLVTCGLGHFWGLIDGIMILANGGTDAQGRVLRES
jgi:TM2 domain-containing membrane protein YozV